MLCADTTLTLANSAAVLSKSFLFIVLRSITSSSNACGYYLAAQFIRPIVEHGAFSRRRLSRKSSIPPMGEDATTATRRDRGAADPS
jgi:hypothetical protein